MKKTLLACAAGSLLSGVALANPGGQTSIDLVLEGSVSEVLSVAAAQADVNIMTGGNTQQVALLTVACNLPGDVQLSVSTTNDFKFESATAPEVLDYGIRITRGTSLGNAGNPDNVITQEPGQATGVETGTIDCSDAVFDDGSEQYAFGVIKLGSSSTAGTYSDTVTIEVASLP